MKRSSQPSSTTPGKRAGKTCRSGSRLEASNAKSRKNLFHFRPEKVNKFEYCNNLQKQNIFHNPVRRLKACLSNNLHAVCAMCMQIFIIGSLRSVSFSRALFFLYFQAPAMQGTSQAAQARYESLIINTRGFILHHKRFPLTPNQCKRGRVKGNRLNRNGSGQERVTSP